MPSIRVDPPFAITYLLIMACQAPIWLCGGLLWGVGMTFLAGVHPVGAFAGGLLWGLAMWVLLGNLFAVAMAWRRSATLPMADEREFRAALEQVCAKLKLVVLAESPDELVLGPRWVLVRFPFQEVRFEFEEDETILTAPVLSLRAIRKALDKALDGSDRRRT